MSSLNSAWSKFFDIVALSRRNMDSIAIPVALICLPATANDDDSFDVDLDGKILIVWPADAPVEERGRLLRRMADSYYNNEVIR